MNNLKKLLIIVVFCSCTAEDNKTDKIQYIDQLIHGHLAVPRRVFTDTSVTESNTIFTRYHYDEEGRLAFMYIEETATDIKYVSYISNDSLVKITVNIRDPYYSSDEAASYYINNDSVFHKVETRGKLEDISKLILDQKRNINYFRDSLTGKGLIRAR